MTTSKQTFHISGHVIDQKTRHGVDELRVEAWDKDLLVDDLVGSAMTDEQGAFRLEITPAYFSELFLDRHPDLFFKVFQGQTLIKSTEDSVLWNVSDEETKITIEVNGALRKGPVEPMLATSSPISAAKKDAEIAGSSAKTLNDPGVLCRVQGHIFFDYGMPAAGLSVRLYNRGFGCTDSLLGESKTDGQGFYILSYEPGSTMTNIEVRVVDAKGNEVSLSATKFKAGKNEVLNLVAPANVRPLAPEYERLIADLNKQLGEKAKLSDARENSDCKDLTLLHQSTGWDARLIALAATAGKLSDSTGISRDALYALLRAGLPIDPQQLALLSSRAVEKALGKATEARIVDFDDNRIAETISAFERFAGTARLAAKAPGALSSVGDLLSKSGLDAKEQRVFQDLFFARGEAADDLWESARREGISDEKISGLQLQGKLAYLTANNADLTQSLQREIGSPDNLMLLVEKDLYQADAWKGRLNELSGNDESALTKLIPPAYKGATTSDRLDAYAADLARKVRITFPTQVIGRKIETDELSLGDDHETFKPAVATFLKNADSLGFELGRTAVGAFIRDNHQKLFEDKSTNEIEGITRSIKKLHRLYQIRPTDEALKTVLDLGFASSHDVTAIPYEDFLARHADKFPSAQEAQLVYRKAQQVSAVTLNILTSAQQLNSSHSVYAMSAPEAQRKEAVTNLVKHYPAMEPLFGSSTAVARTVDNAPAMFADAALAVQSVEPQKELIRDIPSMELLFGSLDFCECEHCRSVLSPAAYFVDLLKFLDPKDSNLERKPYDVLVERRPDLPNLPLTCENTNIVLPYIDVVNEILEYYVAHDGLASDAAHDTGNATTAELLAEPQNIIPAAYEVLGGERYPLMLPFDLWLETVRRFFDHFETPLWQVSELFRPTDELFAPSAPTIETPYYRSDIFAEYLGLSPTEHGLFTNPTELKNWHILYGYKTRDDALNETVLDGQRVDLRSAKALSRRLGVSYKKLVELIGTGFVNPRLETLVTLRKLDLDVHDVYRYKRETFTAQERTAFKERLDKLTKSFRASGFNASDWLDTAWLNGDFDQILVLADSNTGCNFDLTTLRYADGAEAGDLVFLKINLFVRLWKKLGWTIEETDRALQVFLPSSVLTSSDSGFEPDFGAAFNTALLYFAHLKALDEQVMAGRNSRLKLLTLWSNLSTTGETPLYAQLFLTRSVLKNDQVFDDPIGRYLSNETVFVNDHLPAVQGALGLTADEIRRILTDAGKDLDTAKLLLENVSLLHRYGLLAKALKLSVRDLISLKRLSGLDPFQPLVTGPVSTLNEDHPFSQTLRFVEVAKEIRESGFGLEDLEYLFRHRFDAIGRYRTSAEPQVVLVKRLGAGMYRILEELGLPAALSGLTDDALRQILVSVDPPPLVEAFLATLSDDVLRQKLALILSPEVVDTFFGMWTGTVKYEAVQPARIVLDPTEVAQEPAIHRLVYDEVKREQRLIFQGVLVDPERTRLVTLFPALQEMLNDVHEQAFGFFQRHLEKSSTGEHSVGFIPLTDFDSLFTPARAIPDDLLEPEKQIRRRFNEQQVREKRSKLAQAFLPFLQQKLTRQLVVETLAASFNGDVVLIERLLTDADLLTDSRPPRPLLEAFTAARELGISVEFFDTARASLGKRTVAAADMTGKPNGTDSARFEGYFEVPTPGAYRFFVVCGRLNAEAELRIGDLPDPVIRCRATRNSEEFGQFIELKAGVPYRFTLDAISLSGGNVLVEVQGQNLPKGNLSRLTVYPQSTVERVGRARVLLAKTLQLIHGLGLSECDVRHILTHRTDFDDIDLSNLPTRDVEREVEVIVEKYRASDSTLTQEQALARARVENPELVREAENAPALAVSLFNQFLRLAGYARLKRDLAGGTDDLIAIFENARHNYPASTDSVQVEQLKTALFNDLCKRLGNLTRRDAATVQAAAHQLGFAATSTSDVHASLVQAADFAQEKGIQRLWEVLQMVEKIAVPVAKIKQWTAIVGGTTPPDDGSVIARELRNTVKARYEGEGWQGIAQPIFDKLRQRQRDALVAYIIHRNGFKNMEQLFEHFLIDPGMEAVAQTSRLRLAISSVQLFVQRCLLNLEPQVRPFAINSKHWDWMKRYRVWEANRKIFLFPENWLEPEFRDDKTHLFKELEGALLQSDVSNDMAETAFFGYLKKLDQLARLEIVTMYCEERPGEPDSNTLHVIGRTYNLPHKYFYRRYSHQMWTPWEPVTAEIEGDHVVAAVWHGRLHLFWVTFLEKAKEDTNAGIKIKDMAEQTVAASVEKQVEVQLNWSEYFQGQWTTRESSGFSNPIRIDVDSSFKNRDVFIHVSKQNDNSAEESVVRIHLHFEKAILGKRTTRSGPDSDPVVTLVVGPNDVAFQVVNKNSQPEIRDGEAPQYLPYPSVSEIETRYGGADRLQVSFIDHDEFIGPPQPRDIIQTGPRFSLLMPSNLSSRELTSQFFYEDNQHTFFVEPTLKEITTRDWNGFIILLPNARMVEAEWLNTVPMQSQVPAIGPPIPPDPLSLFTLQSTNDLFTNPATAIQFNGEAIGQRGGLDLQKNGASAVVNGSSESKLNVIGASGLSAGVLEIMNSQRGLKTP